MVASDHSVVATASSARRGSVSLEVRIHGDVAFLPLRVGDGGKDHDSHHEFRDFHCAVDRLAEPVPQEHVDERQEHHEHEDAHARRAEPFGEAFRREQRGRGPVEKTCSVGMRAFHTSFPCWRGVASEEHPPWREARGALPEERPVPPRPGYFLPAMSMEWDWFHGLA